MSIRINPNVNPFDTEHIFKLFSGNKPVEPIYRVLYVTPQHAFVPDAAEPVVYLRLSRKVGYAIDNFISLPLSVFVAVSMPFGDKDVFWVQEKTVQE